ncbi:MAG: ABC transporter ATP-binding protein, partial [Candidatus Ranarchaeia archaeon]
GSSIIYVTHDLEFITEYESISRIILMKKGKIIADDEPRAIFRNEDVLNKSGLHLPEIVKISKSVDWLKSKDIFSVEELVNSILEEVLP